MSKGNKNDVADVVEQTETVAETAAKEAEAVAADAAAPKKRGRKKASDKPAETKQTKTTAKTASKEAAKPEIQLQFQGNDVDIDTIIEQIKSKYVSEGHRAALIKSLQVYVKPEENAAFYVINGGKSDGKVNLW